MDWREKSVLDPWDALRRGSPRSPAQAPGLWEEVPFNPRRGSALVGGRWVWEGSWITSLILKWDACCCCCCCFKEIHRYWFIQTASAPLSFAQGLLFGAGAAAFHAWLTSVQPYTEIFCPNIHKANYFGKRESTIKYKTQLYST